MITINSLLTLSIAQTKPNQNSFYIITLDLKNQNYIAISLDSKDIVSKSGEIFFDIGFVSQVTYLRPKYPSKNYLNMVYIASDVSILENKFDELKNILDAKSATQLDFFDNKKKQFSILKVNKINDIFYTESSGYFKHKVNVTIMGLPVANNTKTLLVKDFRWINYWDWTIDRNIYVEKKTKYLNMFRKRDRELYLVLFRYHKKDGSSYELITGVHWI